MSVDIPYEIVEDLVEMNIHIDLGIPVITAGKMVYQYLIDKYEDFQMNICLLE